MDKECHKAKRPRKEKLRTWTRSDVSTCMCPDLSYRHSHCPCDTCNGKAVSSSTEFYHWEKNNLLAKSNENSWNIEIPGESSSDISDEENELENLSDVITEGSGDDESTLEENASDVIIDEGSGATNATGLGSCGSQPHSDGQKDGPGTSDNIKEEIVSCILRGLILAEEMTSSVTDIEKLLKYAKDLYCKGDCNLEKYWPSNWRETEKLLKDVGYENPKEYFICLDDSHHANCDIMDNKGSLCRFCGKPGAIKYYYLGLPQKVKLWCADDTFCQKMAKFWEEREHWLHHEGPWYPLKEVWDGSRFSEVSWFWDPDCEWFLPTRCSFCSSVLSAEEIEGSPYNGHSYTVTCCDCGSVNTCKGEKAKGDPRNIALMGHWDGWYPFHSKSSHSCGAIDVSVVNMSKTDRCSTSEVYVVGFVPCYKVPNKRPCALDPFLEPLVRDLEDSFMKGTKVHYARDIGGCISGEAIVRCMLLLWTGDLPAQCEVGKFINCGIFPCRRHQLRGTSIGGGSTYYIGGNRYHARFPVAPRNLQEDVSKMSEIENEDRTTVRAALARQSGYTGLSILHRLHKMYGFNVLTDMVFDMMHNIPLNVVSKHLNRYLREDLVDKSILDKRLQAVPWTSELKDGRIPKSVSKIGHWKAEEYRKFSFPASECVLGGLIEDKQFEIWVLVTRMAEMVYFYGRGGWKEEDLLLFNNLSKRHMILVEEELGLDQCVVTAHNLEHTIEDIVRFSSPDNYWCEVYERAVSHYIATSSNKKNIELTFAKAEARRELLKSLKSKVNLPVQTRSGKSDSTRVCASSLSEAKELSSELSASQDVSGGILVGKQQNNVFRLSINERSLLSALFPRAKIENEYFKYSGLWKPSGVNGIMFKTGESVLVADDNDQEIVVNIGDFVCATVGDKFYSLLRGELYSAIEDDEGMPEIYCYNFGMLVIPSAQQVVFHTDRILRKIMLYPNPENLENPSHFITIDPMRKRLPVSYANVIVPFYPQGGDMVIVSCEDGNDYIANIVSVQEGHKTAKVFFYVDDYRNPGVGRYVRESYGHGSLHSVAWNCIKGLADGHWEGNVWKQ